MNLLMAELSPLPYGRGSDGSGRSGNYLAVYPPSTIRGVAVMKEASSEAKKRMAYATSRGWPTRLSRCKGALLARKVSSLILARAMCFSVAEVRIVPGQTQLTRMLYGARSMAMQRVMFTRAALVAL